MNLPISEPVLFSPYTDEEMDRMKKEAETLKAVGLEEKRFYGSQYKRIVYRQYQRQRVKPSQWSYYQQNQGQPQ